MVRKHDDEQLLNGKLAELLSELGVLSEAEQKVGRRKIDVIAEVDGIGVMLEAEAGFGKRRQAIGDADARLKQGLTVIVFAVCYPDDARVTSLADADLLWTLRTKEDAPWDDSDWSRGSIEELKQAVQRAPAQFDDVEGAARILSQGLDAGAQRLSPLQREALARAINLPDLNATGQRSDQYFTAAKRGLLVIATAMLFHHRLHAHLPGTPPTQWDGDWPPKTASSCALNRDAALSEFDYAWEAILSVDYAPVFESARLALAALPATGDASQLVQTLAKVVGQVARLVSGMRHDLLGRIFHRVLDTAKYDGSYYTSTAAGTLLANLAIQLEDCNWADTDAISQLRICDPACGTGTLLMAAARRVHDLRQHLTSGDEDDEELLAESLVEDVLWGYDINLTATHMAASALGMLSPTTRFRNMNVHIPRFGVEGQAKVGSLELLDTQMELTSMPGTVRQVEGVASQSAEQPRDMSLVIMNPPFTRDSLRYDQFSAADERKLKDREKEVVKQHHHSDAVHLSGGSSVFLVLGEHITATQSGVLAAVLPASSLTAPSGLAHVGC